ncbi:MAG: hypothetical protein WBM34_00215 [Woeseiaceae bacterium]
MRLAAIIALILGSLAAPASLHADHSMVLIVNAESSIDHIKPVDLRKVYLGFTVTKDGGRVIRAVTNRSNTRLWEIFLQDVMGMSERSYDRRLLSLTLQSGRLRPAVFYDLDQVIDILKSDKDTLAFAWQEDVKDNEDIRIVRVLWQL